MFVKRDGDGKIVACFRRMQPGIAEEEVADTDPTVVAFMAPKSRGDWSDLEQCRKVDKALAACIAQIGGLTPAQMKALFKQKYDALPSIIVAISIFGMIGCAALHDAADSKAVNDFCVAVPAMNAALDGAAAQLDQPKPKEAAELRKAKRWIAYFAAGCAIKDAMKP